MKSLLERMLAYVRDRRRLLVAVRIDPENAEILTALRIELRFSSLALDAVIHCCTIWRY